MDNVTFFEIANKHVNHSIQYTNIDCYRHFLEQLDERKLRKFERFCNVICDRAEVELTLKDLLISKDEFDRFIVSLLIQYYFTF